jgi:hypothetical protein
LGSVFGDNISTQNFVETKIPQTTIDSSMTDQCTNNSRFAFYSGQKIKFTSTLQAGTNDTWRIMNT